MENLQWTECKGGYYKEWVSEQNHRVIVEDLGGRNWKITGTNQHPIYLNSSGRTAVTEAEKMKQLIEDETSTSFD